MEVVQVKNTDPIKKAKDGRYYFRANLGRNQEGKKIQKYQSGFKTKKEAREAYSKAIIYGKETLKQQRNMNFKKFIQEIFLPWRKSNVSRRSYEGQLPTMLKHFSYFNKFNLREIQPIHVQEWQIQTTKRICNNSLRKVYSLLTMAFERAIVLGLADINPALIVGNVKKEESKIDFWTKTEFEKVISKIDMTDYYERSLFVALWILFMTGIRLGEMTALTWNDVNIKKGIIKINKTLYFKSFEEHYTCPPKTKNGEREVVLDKHTIQILSAWKKIQGKIVKTKYVHSVNELPFQPTHIGKAIGKYSKMAKVKKITVHGLRHSHASLLINMGENPLVIRDRLGHSDIKITLGTYGHLYPNTNFEVAKKLKSVVDDKLILKMTN